MLQKTKQSLQNYFILFKKISLEFLRKFIATQKKQWNSNTLISYFKITVIAVILVYFYTLNIGSFDYVILFYALLSIFFVFDSRLSAAIALGGLILIPLLLFRKNDVLAEKVATKVYYFLVITVATQLRELQYENRYTKEIIKNDKLEKDFKDQPNISKKNQAALKTSKKGV